MPVPHRQFQSHRIKPVAPQYTGSFRRSKFHHQINVINNADRRPHYSQRVVRDRLFLKRHQQGLFASSD